ncbi:MAG: DUF4340 domain-containing protein [Acidobacteriota bacterium]
MSESVTKTNQKLLAAAVALLALSAWSYHHDVQRAERFERGQKFLPNLNPDEIARVEVRKGDEETVLRRAADGESFEIPSLDGYRAKNNPVNRLIKDVLEISLEKEVGSGESLQQELKLTAGDDRDPETVEVALFDGGGNDMVRFLLGSSLETGGTYLRRIDGDRDEIYLTDKRVFLTTDGDGFVDKDVLDVSPSEVASVRGADFSFQKPEDGGDAALVDLPAGQKESSQARQVKTVLQGLRFVKHFLADAPEVQGLRFDRQLEVVLDDGSGYLLESAQQGDKHYLRLEGFHTSEKVAGGRILMQPDASEEEMKETSELMARVDELQQFNIFHGSWIYEVTANTADRIRAAKADLLEDA